MLGCLAATPEADRLTACNSILDARRTTRDVIVMAFITRGQLFAARNEAPRALADLNEAIRLDPRVPDAYQARAAVYQQQGDAARALADLNEAIGLLAPASPDLLLARARLHQQRNDAAMAAADIDRVLTVNPLHAGALRERGLINRTRNPEQALADLDRILTATPADVPALMARAELRQTRGDAAGARRDIDEAVRLAPTDVNLRSVRVSMLLAANDQTAALAELTAIGQQDATLVAPHRLRADLLQRSGQLDMAIAAWGEVIRREPRDREAYEARGLLHAQRTRGSSTTNVINDLTQAITLGSNTAQVFRTRADAHMRRGARNLAIADYRRALQADSNDQTSRTALRRLGIRQ